MPRGPKKHLKRINAPKHWMLDKLSGIFAPRPSSGPHKLRECLPLILLLRNRLKYALTKKEVTMILMQRLVKIDGKVRTDPTYPAGFMDVVHIDKTNENFRLLYDTKGRFTLHRISEEEAQFKLLKVKKYAYGSRGVPYIVTHDGRTIRYPHPEVRVNDVVKFDLTTGTFDKFIKFNIGNLCMTTGGSNIGRVGILTNKETHPGAEQIVHLKDARGSTWTTLASNVFLLGEGNESLVSLPKDKGIRLSNIEDRERRLRKSNN